MGLNFGREGSINSVYIRETSSHMRTKTMTSHLSKDDSKVTPQCSTVSQSLENSTTLKVSFLLKMGLSKSRRFRFFALDFSRPIFRLRK